MAKNPVATIIMKSGGIIRIELYPETAPNTVNNFISLAEKGFYDGLTFHRVICDFMIQGGCPDGTGFGDPGYDIKGEFSSNGFENDLKHEPGVISMARDTPPDTAGSQFFIMHKYTSRLDGNYAGFGMVIQGMEEVDRIARVTTGADDKPVFPEIMESVRVKCFGVRYAEPEIIPKS